MTIRAFIATVAFALLIAINGCTSTESSVKESPRKTATTTAAPAQSAKGQWQSFGETVVFDDDTQVALGSLKGDEKNIWVVGEITEVCSHQGCWIRVKDTSNPAAGDLFVRTKDHAYLVPRNAAGHSVKVFGVCELSEMSVADQRHFAEEAGKSEAEIAKITQPKNMIIFHAATIMIEGPGLDKPLEQ